MGDTDKAVAVCVDYLAWRPGIRTRLLAQVDDGMKAQNLEGTRTTGIHIPEEGEEVAEPDAGPRVTDTTGETAIRWDKARLLLTELDRAERALILEANILAGHPIAAMCDLLGFLGPLARTSPGRVRSSARVFNIAIGETYGRHRPEPGKALDGRPGCQSCSRYAVKGTPLFSEPDYNGGRPTDLGGLLASKHALCRACYRFAMNQEPTRLPTVKELAYRNDDPRGRWPTRHADAA